MASPTCLEEKRGGASSIPPAQGRAPVGRSGRRRARSILAAAALAAVWAPGALGGNHTISTSTDWNNVAAWGGSGIPLAGENAYVVPSGQSDIIVSFDG